MDNLHEVLTKIQIDIAEIKTDVRHHIKRTEIAEENIATLRAEHLVETTFLRKHIYMVQGAVALVGLLATIVTILSKL